jgi:hypothetical protein
MTKISNQYSLTNVLFADTTNGRVGVNNGSPTVALDVTGAGKLSSSLTTAGAIFTTNDSVFNTAGTITKHATVGLVVRGTTASVFDYSLYSAGGTALMTNPTGTNNINFNSGQVWFNGGNVGIGTTSPLTNLTIGDSATQQQPYISLARNSLGGYWAGIRWYDGSTVKSYIQEDSDFNLRFGTSNTERMRIHPNGTKYFGTFDSSRLQINPAGEQVLSYTNNYYIWGIFNDSNSLSIESAFAGNIIFRAQAQSTSSSPTTATERMRITSGGDLLISNTDGTGKIVVAGDDNAIILRSRNTSASGAPYQFYIFHSLGDVSIGNYRGSVSYNSSSDYRLKEDLKEFNGLDILSSINFYDFKWKESQVRNYGIIAHEVQEILPYLVEGGKDELLEDGSVKAQQVDISKLVPILGKAIQEQQTQINELKALINA